MNEAPRGEVGQAGGARPDRLPLHGRRPAAATMCANGWNLTGDSLLAGRRRRFHFAARSDDMIISAGYNIAGPEVEAALLAHPDVKECAVIGAPDEDRGQIVEAMSCWPKASRATS
jgi:2-aminobenzoate-CoA ligase